MSFLPEGVGQAVAAAGAGLPFPKGDPEGLRDAARDIGAAASKVSLTGHMIGWSAAAATSWEGAASGAFRGAVGDEQAVMAGASGSLEGAAGALSKLATEIEDAQKEVADLAAKVVEAEDAAEEAETRAAVANLAAAGAATALDLFGADPPSGLVDARAGAEDAAGSARGSASQAREHATNVKRQAERRARELCDDCERQDRVTASTVNDAAAAAPKGSGVGAMPGASYSSGVAKRMTVSDFKELAFLRAGIDPTAWKPREGLGANDETVRKVYAYYKKLGLEHDEFQWLKMAAIGGPLFYAGFRDIDRAGNLADKAGILNPTLGPLGMLGAGELRWHEGQFLTMQKAIFSDLAWQHEAFALGGVAAIRGAVAKQPAGSAPVLDANTLGAWDDIGSGDPDRVADGNFKLIEREQGPVIQRYYNEMHARDPALTYALTKAADTPIPGSETYLEHSHLPVLEGLPEGNIADYGDRMDWIRESLWPAHQELLQKPGGVDEILGRDFDSEADRYTQVSPEAILKKAAPPLIPPISPIPIFKLLG